MVVKVGRRNEEGRATQAVHIGGNEGEGDGGQSLLEQAMHDGRRVEGNG